MKSRKANKATVEKVYVGTGFYLGLLVVVVLGVAVIGFVASNTDNVTIRWFGLEFAAPLAAAVLVASLATAIVVEMLGWFWRRSRRRVLRERDELRRLRADAKQRDSETEAAEAAAPLVGASATSETRAEESAPPEA